MYSIKDKKVVSSVVNGFPPYEKKKVARLPPNEKVLQYHPLLPAYNNKYMGGMDRSSQLKIPYGFNRSVRGTGSDLSWPAWISYAVNNAYLL